MPDPAADTRPIPRRHLSTVRECANVLNTFQAPPEELTPDASKKGVFFFKSTVGQVAARARAPDAHPMRTPYAHPRCASRMRIPDAHSDAR